VLEKYGIVYERDHSQIDCARCSSILYEKGNKPDFDYTVPNEDCTVVDMKTEDNKYLHRDFHLLGDNALKYCAEIYGKDAVREFLRDFAKSYYAPQIELFKSRGLAAVKEWLEKLYETEESAELLSSELSDSILTVVIEKSPVIEYMHTLNQEPSEYYIEETRTLYAAIAEASNLSFKLEYYNTDGGTKYIFAIK
jgi:hypothetical protein